MLPLLQATQNPPPEIGSRSLVYDLGPWKGDNLLAGIESFFQKNAYHPLSVLPQVEVSLVAKTKDAQKMVFPAAIRGKSQHWVAPSYDSHLVFTC